MSVMAALVAEKLSEAEWASMARITSPVTQKRGQAYRPAGEEGARRTGTRHAGGRRQRRVLTPPARALIEARYDGRTETIDELQQRLGVPRWQVRKWGAELGLARRKEPPWSEAEMAYLEAQVGRTSLASMARHLGRTRVAVRLKMKRLELRMRDADGAYTQRALAAALGVDDHKVARWRERGWLKGAPRETERTPQQGGDMWRYLPRDVRAFVRACPAEVDPRRVEWPWLVGLLTGGH